MTKQNQKQLQKNQRVNQKNKIWLLKKNPESSIDVSGFFCGGGLIYAL